MDNVIRVNFKRLSTPSKEQEGKLIEFSMTPELRRKRIYKLEAEIDRLEKIHGFNHPQVNKLWDEVEELWQEIFKGA